MNELKIFEREEFGQVRVVEREGQPWFVASDIAKALQYERPNDAIHTHCKKVNKFSYGDQPHGAMAYNIIPESDVYRLIMRSNMPKAVEFQDWVCEEVLPSIRKTGSYNAAPAIPNFADPAEAAIAWAEQYRRAQIAEATKAEIGSRREATAMNTASQAVKQVKRLEIELDRSKEYASVKAVEALTKQKFNWRPLRNYCTANELDMKKIHDANYGAVNTYPAEAWQEVYGVHLCELF